MNNHLTDADLLKRYMKAAKRYGEFGAGDSTFFASIEPSIEEIYSVESDAKWIEDTRIRLERPATFYYREMGTAYMAWGQPGPNATAVQKAAYSDPFPGMENIDLLLIDGRFRVACALKAHKLLNNNALIAFDDFLNRKHYHIVLNYFITIDSGKTMVILKKKAGIEVPDELVRSYEQNAD